MSGARAAPRMASARLRGSRRRPDAGFGADLLSEQHKYHRSMLKRRTSRAILGGAAALVAISTWTRDLALTVLGELGLDGHGQRLRVVHPGTDPERFRRYGEVAQHVHALTA